MTLSPQRQEALRTFAARALADDGVAPEPASADASFRSYWRVASRGKSFIVMNAPPDKEDVRPWLDIAHRLRDARVNAPQIFAEDLADGFILMSDLGTRLYLPELNDATVDTLYRDALDALLGIQTRASAEGLPKYDEERLRTEMELLPTWFLQRHLGVQPGCAGWELVEAAFRVLIDNAVQQPQVFVHRDYHSRNLLICPPPDSPGIVDFQDAVLGPVTYDLVSLLRDCYIRWPGERVYAWANDYRDRLVDRGVLKFGEVRWKRWFDLMGLQRHIKVLGIFCRLWYRDGKRGYLGDLPLVLAYTLEVAGKYKELAPFAEWLKATVGTRDLTVPRT